MSVLSLIFSDLLNTICPVKEGWIEGAECFRVPGWKRIRGGRIHSHPTRIILFLCALPYPEFLRSDGATSTSITYLTESLSLSLWVILLDQRNKCLYDITCTTRACYTWIWYNIVLCSGPLSIIIPSYSRDINLHISSKYLYLKKAYLTRICSICLNFK